MDFSTTLTNLKNQHLYRQRKTVQSAHATKISIDGQTLINFCSNDYLSLSRHPQIIKAFKNGVNAYGVGSGASHLVSGHCAFHQQLEEALADYVKQPRALLFSSGYAANLGVFSALKDELNWVLQDKLNHASLIDANHLINLPLQRYTHNNPEALAKKASKQVGVGLIATDTVFSMDGDHANIDKIGKIGGKSNALLLQDAAHSFGIFPAFIPKNSIYMATLGKAAGTMGAFVAGDEDFIELLMQKSRPYIYTTALPPSLCAATLKSLDLIKQGQQKAKLCANIDYFKQQAKALKLPFLSSNSAIQPLIIGSSEQALKAGEMLYQAGFYLSAIRPPTVPKNTSRLRITLNANHTSSQIRQLLAKISVIYAKLKP